MENTLEINNLCVQFGSGSHAEFAVKDVSFTLRRGEILGIVGESGSGKSVTCHALTGLLPHGGNHTVSGEALFCGTDLFTATRSELRNLRRNRISMVFQDPMSALNPYMSVGEQITESLLQQPDVSEDDAMLRAISLLEEVGIVEAAHRFDDYPHTFSGGMRQRVLIAMALITDPEVLIADEPTSALDVTTQAHIVSLIKEAQALRDMSVIFISHDLGVVRSIADRVVVMERGRVVEQGESWQIFDRPAHPYTRKLLEAIPRSAKPAEYRFRRDGSPDFLDVKNIQVSFGGEIAVDDVSFTVQQGETLGIVGESGSGKSTLSRAIVKLVRPDHGQVLFSGIPLLSSSGHAFRQQRKKVQMVFQDPYSSLNPRMTAYEIIAEPMLLHGITIGKENATKRVIKLMRDVGLPVRSLYKYPHEFSGGQCQRIAIARALASEPQLLVADEPVSALDVTVQAEILTLLLNLVKSKNLTMIFISHDLAVVRYVADRVAVMESGRFVELGDTEKLYADPKHHYTRTLIETTVEPGQE